MSRTISARTNTAHPPVHQRSGRYLGGKVLAAIDELITAAGKIDEQRESRIFGAFTRGKRPVELADTLTGIVLDAGGDEKAALLYSILGQDPRRPMCANSLSVGTKAEADLGMAAIFYAALAVTSLFGAVLRRLARFLLPKIPSAIAWRVADRCLL